MEKEPLYQFYKELEIKDLLEILRRRKRVVLGFFASFVFMAGIYTFTTIPIYEASTQILIEREHPKILMFEEVYAVDTSAAEYYQTQYRILKSRSLAERVVDRLNLTALPDFQTGDAASQVLAMVSINPIARSRLVNIDARSANPQLAATVANAWAEEYVKKDLDHKLSATRYAVDWLNEELKHLKKRVEESEKRLQEYKETHQLVSLEDTQNIVVQKLQALSSAATQAKSQRAEAETKYKQIEQYRHQEDKLETLPGVLDDSLIKDLKAGYAAKEARLSELLKRYKDKHPRIIELRSEMETHNDSIKKEINKFIDSIIAAYEESKANENAALLALAEQERKALELNRMAIEYNVLKRDAETNREMYNSLLKRMKETDISGGLQASNIRVIDKAEVPKEPVMPKKRANIAISCFLGLLAGIAAAFTLEYFDDSIRNQKDIEAYIQLPFLGHIPAVKMKGFDAAMYASKYPRSEAGESLRSVRTNINFTLAAPPPHVILVTSVVPQEGKTTVSSNLSITFAMGKERTLLVDCDMRHPTVHRIYGIDNSIGLRGYLSGAAGFDAVVKKTPVPDLSVVPSGPVPHNPIELLESDQCLAFFKEAKSKFDKIVIDSPPIIAVSDGLILAKFADGIVYVVRGAKTSREIVFEGKRKLGEIDAKVLGIVLNNLDMRKQKYYYTYYYYHGGKSRKEKSIERFKDIASTVRGKTKSEGAPKAEGIDESDDVIADEKSATTRPRPSRKRRRQTPPSAA